MSRIKVGIQGERGSTNERACNLFAAKHGWTDYEIHYLVTTENVLRALNAGEVEYGTFVWKSTRGGLVKETRDAIAKYRYSKVDEEDIQLDHALLINSQIDRRTAVRIFSHPQALEEHRSYLISHFHNPHLNEEVDTAVAARKLRDGEYPDNSLIIAPIGCAELYDLDVYLADLPTNKGYLATIYLVKSP